MKFEESDLLKGLPKQFFANLVEKVNAKIAQGVDVINLGQGNPDQPTPDYIVKAAQTATENPKNHKYSPFRGVHELKVAAAEFYQEKYHVDVEPEQEVAILAGSKIGLVELPLALMNPGELMLLPDPGYPDYWSGSSIGRVEFETIPLVIENHFLPDLSKIPETTAKKAKFLYLNYPNNPTGATATREFYENVVAFAKKYQVGIISDFAYGAIGFDGQTPISFMEIDGAKEVGVEFYTYSKTFNMAGWRLGFAVGNKDIIEAINLIQDHLFVSCFPALQEAGIVALRDPNRDSAISNLVSLYEKRRDVFVRAAEKIGWKAFIPGGSFYVLMPVPKTYTSETFSEVLLERAGVAVAPANGFGKYGEGYVRIGLLVAPERLVEAVNRIALLNLF